MYVECKSLILGDCDRLREENNVINIPRIDEESFLQKGEVGSKNRFLM